MYSAVDFFGANFSNNFPRTEIISESSRTRLLSTLSGSGLIKQPMSRLLKQLTTLQTRDIMALNLCTFQREFLSLFDVNAISISQFGETAELWFKHSSLCAALHILTESKTKNLNVKMTSGVEIFVLNLNRHVYFA